MREAGLLVRWFATVAVGYAAAFSITLAVMFVGLHVALRQFSLADPRNLLPHAAVALGAGAAFGLLWRAVRRRALARPKAGTVLGAFRGSVAIRYLHATQRHTMISLISFICVAGVAVGVTVLIVVLAVMAGFDRDLRERILGAQAHLFVLDPFDRTLKDPEGACQMVAKVEGVVGCTPYAFSQVMLKFEGGITGALLWGIQPKTARLVTDLAKHVSEGDLAELERPLDPERGTPVFIGREMARKHFLTQGESVTIVAPVFTSSAAGLIPRTQRAYVAGIFATGFYEYDTTFAYTGLGAAQKLLDLGKGVHGLEVRLTDLYDAKRIGAAIREASGKTLWVQDWMERNRNLFEALLMERWMMGIILAFLVLLAAFNIVGLLIMVVLDRMRDIGVLASLGATPGQIRGVFVAQGTWIGVAGTLLGVAGGLLVCVVIDRLDLPMPGGGNVYYITKLPVRIEPWLDLAVIPMLAMLASFGASLYPAWRASRLPPVDALRYE